METLRRLSPDLPLSLCAVRCAGRVRTLRRPVAIWHPPGEFPSLSTAKERSPHHQANPLKSFEKLFQRRAKVGGCFIYLLYHGPVQLPFEGKGEMGAAGWQCDGCPLMRSRAGMLEGQQEPEPSPRSISVRWLLWLWKCHKTVKSVSS